jgi:hypothetical protein
VNAVLREITNMCAIRESSVVRSSVIPSAKYCWSGSLLRLANGSTTIDSRGGEPSAQGESERQFMAATTMKAKHTAPAAIEAMTARRCRAGAPGFGAGDKPSIGHSADGSSGSSSAAIGPPAPLADLEIETAVMDSDDVTGATKR